MSTLCNTCKHLDEEFDADPCVSCHNNEKYESIEYTGHWIFTRYFTWSCSECGKNPTRGMGYVPNKEFMQEEFKYCNHCGAKMEVRE